MENRLKLLSVGNAILASGMVVCLTVTVGRLLLAISGFPVMERPAVQAGGVLGLFLVGLEVQLTRRWQDRPTIFSRSWWKAILVEWGLLILGTLAFVWQAKGGVITLSGVLTLPQYALMEIIDGEYFIGLVLLGLAWGFSCYLSMVLIKLEESTVPVSEEPVIDPGKEQSDALKQMWFDVFFFGVISILLSIFGVSIMRLAWGLSIEFGSLGAEVPLYFACGLGLFAFGRIIILRSDWQWEKTRFDSGIARPWMVYGVVFILAVLILSLALPTRYSFDLLSSLNRVLLGITYIGMIIWTGLLLPVLYFLSRLLSFLLLKSETPSEEPTPEVSPPPPSLPSGWDWGQLAREMLFWVVLFLVIYYFIRQVAPFLRTAILRRAWRGPFFRWLRRALFTLRSRLAAWRRAAGAAIRDSFRSAREDFAQRTGRERHGFLSLRGLSPRQSIRFYFFALLRRGAGRGIVRRSSQTPREYAVLLAQAGSDVESELLEMTAAFEEARYTSHEIGPENARRVRKLWERIRWSLRSGRRKDQTGVESQ